MTINFDKLIVKLPSKIFLICFCQHETRKHGHDHLGSEADDILRKSVDRSPDLPGHGDGVLGVPHQHVLVVSSFQIHETPVDSSRLQGIDQLQHWNTVTY